MAPEAAGDAYRSASRYAARVLALTESDSSLAQRANRVETLAAGRILSLTSPEGTVTCLIDGLVTGNFDDFALFVDFEATTVSGIGQEAWDSLSMGEKARLVGCVRASTEAWVSEKADYFRSMQWRIEDIEVSGDEAVVDTVWTSLGAMVHVRVPCLKSESGWRVREYEVPYVGISVVRYIRETVADLVQEFGTLSSFLAQDDAEQICVKAFKAVSLREPDVEDSLVGQEVRLSEDPDVTYEVIKQTRREDEFHLLIIPKGQVGAAPKWVNQSEAELVEAEEELWLPE